MLVDTATTALVDASTWPAAATMYTRITEGISAIFGTELMCSGNCQKTVAAVVKFVTALGADAFEVSLTKTTSSATIPLEDYQTEQRQMAEFMPRSGHSARRHTARPPDLCRGVAAVVEACGIGAIDVGNHMSVKDMEPWEVVYDLCVCVCVCARARVCVRVCVRGARKGQGGVLACVVAMCVWKRTARTVSGGWGVVCEVCERIGRSGEW